MYVSYDGRTYYMQLCWEDLLYASYDGKTYCTPVMMRGTIVRQLW